MRIALLRKAKFVIGKSQWSSTLAFHHQTKVAHLLAALKECSISRDLQEGKRLHAEAGSRGNETNVFVANSLINMYSKCGDMAEARKVFDAMACPTLVSWNTLMLGYAENGQEDLALEFLDRIEAEGGGCVADDASYVAAFKACSGLAAREEGEELDGKLVKVSALEKTMDLHAQAVRSGRGLQAMASRNVLVDTYCKCGSMLDARKALDRMRYHSVVSWTALMMGYSENREEELALSLFFLMEEQGLEPNSLMVLSALKACSSSAASEEGVELGGNPFVKMVALEKAMALHREAEKKKCHDELFVATRLLQTYAKSGSLVDARRVFDRMPWHNTVSQNSLILGCAENGDEELALDLFFRFELEGRDSNAKTLVAALKACNALATKEEAKLVDGKLLKIKSLAKTMAVESRARCKDIFVWNTLVDTYAKCGSMVDAHRVFEKMACHSVVSWTALVLGYAEGGDGDFALKLFESMEPGVANVLTYVAALKACITFTGSNEVLGKDESTRGDPGRGDPGKTQVLGKDASAQGDPGKTKVLGSDGSTQGDPGRTQVFGKDGVTQSDQPGKTRRHPRNPDRLSAVSQEHHKEQQLRKVESIHSRAMEAGLDSNMLVASSLVDLYARCGCTGKACSVLEGMSCRDTVAWNTLILGYVENGEAREALECFSRMRSVDRNCKPNAQTFVATLKACTKLAAMEREIHEEEKEKDHSAKAMAMTNSTGNALKIGADLHSQAAKLGLDLDMSVANSLVEMYARCGSMPDARQVFDKITIARSSSQSSSSTLVPLIVGYAENGDAELALEIFFDFHRRSIDQRRDSSAILVAALKASSVLASLPASKAIHAQIARAGLLDQREIIVTNCLVDAYGKCGSALDAKLLFDSIALLDTVTWNSLLAAHGKLGGSTDAVLHLFRTMSYERYRADGITFVAVLAACSHGGLVDTGSEYLQRMLPVYGVQPRAEHYACTVDMLGRANQLAAAVQMARDFGRGSAMIWRAVLGACWKWGNVELGEVAFEALVELDGRDASAFALMANIYGCAGLWDKVRDVAGSNPGGGCPC
ncbi:pentatricopeptide repeat-containing protein At5g16860-like [Selaginella moellendorffii]|uniref:pentatricopeptide repeat-containing protein At5g16860-like n=1 Tax=Selaginella moellendorffii TaxID=88036 RepID=UPI000D1C9AFD|nr:pentatricopeptide repeat-containing protein At5g16860-like [Selaginella moellendorffii]|eukprot:XP_024517306.1 pentatricopeptide repeat-containing protein At5g16860-like [Selaginella moellendorffii]